MSKSINSGSAGFSDVDYVAGNLTVTGNVISGTVPTSGSHLANKTYVDALNLGDEQLVNTGHSTNLFNSTAGTNNVSNGNTSFGVGSMVGVTGARNTALGSSAMGGFLGLNSVGIGNACLISGGSGCSDITVVGQSSAGSLTTGGALTVIGSGSAQNASTCTYSVVLGSGAGNDITTNGNVVLVGANTNSGIFSNVIGLGTNATPTANNQMMISNDINHVVADIATDLGSVAKPFKDLHLSGNAIVSTAPTDNSHLANKAYVDTATTFTTTHLSAKNKSTVVAEEVGVAGNTRITFTKAGTYYVTFSGDCVNTATIGDGGTTIELRKNGVVIEATKRKITGNNSAFVRVPACFETVLTASVNDYVECWWYRDDTVGITSIYYSSLIALRMGS